MSPLEQIIVGVLVVLSILSFVHKNTPLTILSATLAAAAFFTASPPTGAAAGGATGAAAGAGGAAGAGAAAGGAAAALGPLSLPRGPRIPLSHRFPSLA